MTKAKPLPFGPWLVLLAERDDSIGDLKDDFIQDCRRSGRPPTAYKDSEDLRVHMQLNGACSEALGALNEAAELYASLD